jgi:hypothetical protein
MSSIIVYYSTIANKMTRIHCFESILLIATVTLNYSLCVCKRTTSDFEEVKVAKA